MSEAIEQVRNLGPKTAAALAEVGIRSRADLEAAGAVEAYLRLKARAGNVSLNALYAMQAGLMDVDWRHLPDELKAALREAVDTPRR
ncbi:TfoX/Sxy family DNA transformation protein [Hyphobacterium sp.]|uniref:TfoX/Sxy family DNA transformation protein n=1 Tax=Hyphobacterium sp. TaxID=2004662 RepID=UPI003BA88DB6